jgi:hypothetical protein
MESLGAIGMPSLRKSWYDIESILLLLLAMHLRVHRPLCPQIKLVMVPNCNPSELNETFWHIRLWLSPRIWYKSVLPCQVYAISLLFWMLPEGSILTCMSQEKVWCFQSVLLSCLLAHDDWFQLASKLFFHLHTAHHKEHTAQHKETDFSVLLWSMIKGCDCKNVKRDQQPQRVHTPMAQ